MFPLRTLLLMGLCLIPAPGFAQSRAYERHFWPPTGTYTRVKSRADENQSAILDVKQRSSSRIKFHLTALWWPVGRGIRRTTGRSRQRSPSAIMSPFTKTAATA